MHSAQTDTLDRRRLFLIGNLAIFMIGLGFAVRASIAPHLQADLFDPLDVAVSATRVGEALGMTFLGFACTLLLGGALVDWIGMRRMLLLSALGFVLGSAWVLAAAWMPPASTTIWLVNGGLLLTGLGWGAVEAACNPLIAALYPNEKTRRLNILHAWWPGGIAIGGCLGVAFAHLHWPWQINLLMLIVPAAAMVILIARTEFPVTERVASGLSGADMFLELVRSPGIWIWLICMALTASTELAPGQWIELALSRVVGMQGILLLVYVSVLMFVLRHFAGGLARALTPVGVLLAGSVCAAAGLYALSLATQPLEALAAATVWGFGVAWFWPTMIAAVADRYPRGGAFVMGLTGFVGGMALQIVLPFMGSVYDRAKLESGGGREGLQSLSSGELDAVLREAAIASFQSIAVLPLLLIPIFAAIWWRERTRRGVQVRPFGQPL